ncbi:MAG: serine hydrolase domain-containing protein [Chloroflexota bacterium]
MIGRPEHMRTVDAERLERARAALERGVADGVFAGAVALIALGESVVADWAVGFAQREPESVARPMTPDTIFDLASLTKPVAGGTAALLLIEDGVWGLDDTVARFVPAFAAGGKGEITLRQVLTHSTGLPPWRPMYVSAADSEAALRDVCDTDLDYTPGTDIRYSDVSYSLIGHLVRRITGSSIDLFLTERVWPRLGMPDTGYLPESALRGRMAATERGNRYEMNMVADRGLAFDRWRDATAVQVGEVNDGNTFYALQGVSSHAGLFSTARDLLAFARMYLTCGAGLLSPATIAAATANHTPGLSQARGLGWHIAGHAAGDLVSRRSFGHTGFTGTSLVIDPASELTVVLLTNRTHPDATNDQISAFRPRFHNLVAASLA